MWMDTKAEMKEASRSRGSLGQRVLSGLLFFTGDMEHLNKYMQDKVFGLQLAVWGLRGVSRVILGNNPLSGALILAALCWASPWQALLGTLGVLTSTLTAVIMGQDGDSSFSVCIAECVCVCVCSAEVSGGLHGFNGMLVSMLMGVFSSAGDWYWWLLLPACLGSATCVFLFSGLAPLLDRWDLPVAVFPFNIVIVLYLLCTGPYNPYFPHHLATPAGPMEINATELMAVEVLRGIPLGVGQIFACGALGPSLLILGAVLLYSPLLAAHALLGSAVGTLAAFLSAYADIALSNLLGTVGLPACSWAATMIATLMLLLTGSLSTYRIPMGQVMSPEHNLRSRKQWKAGTTAEGESTDV
ncbi:Urea transporter 1 [Dissostichus eleginoides]|uniref:Urea transporter n=1 Tax=Dissostichus eleginoides TaxID=100907 RepID=A0AAD9F6B1_DISEL|nr:Urea transporter 1 [Dissostichus eleginoides]